MRARLEFGYREDKLLIRRQALYGLKSSDAALQEFLADKLDDICFKIRISNPYIWMRPATKPTRDEYYEYIFCYVDNFLCISHEPLRPMKNIQSTLNFNNDKVEEPEFYVGAKLSRRELNGKQVWIMLSTEYIKSVFKNVVEKLKNKFKIMMAKAITPMDQLYHPELDATNELD